jgi:nicotinamide mononucleotide transporter
MNMDDWASWWLMFTAQITLLECIAVLFGLMSVWYARAQNILVFPTGIVSVVIYVYICLEAKLYADMGINAYYFVMSVYGWMYWTRGRANPKGVVPISWNSRREWMLSLSTLLISFLLIFWILRTFTDSDVPGFDALTTSFAFVAMLLMARKKIENWHAWIITDALSIPLYIYKGLWLTSFQYFVFLILAVMGLITWQRQYKNQKHS